MLDFFRKFFDSTDFPARWHCGNWSTFDGYLHIISDVAIWGAYTAIPLVLIYFIRHRRDVPFHRVFVLFAAFILCCGAGHMIEAVIFYNPIYRISGAMKFVTAVVSWATVIALIPLVPKALALRSPEQLERVVVERTRQLRESEANVRSIIDASHDAVITTDPTGRILEWNRNAEAIFGWNRAEATGRPIAELIVPPSLHDEFFERLRNGLATNADLSAQHRIETTAKRKGNQEFPVEMTLAPVCVEETHFVGVFIRDITDRQRAELELQAAKSTAETINRDLMAITQVQPALFECRAHTEVTKVLTNIIVHQFNADAAAVFLVERPRYVNGRKSETALRLVQSAASFSGSDVSADDSAEKIPNDEIFAAVVEKVRRVLIADELTSAADRPLSEWMRKRQFQSLLAFPLVWQGRAAGVLAVFHREAPVGHEVDAYELLCLLGASALQNVDHIIDVQRADTSKAEFLANMSHEIRSPMTAIMGFAERIVSPALTDSERVSAARTILRNSDHLLAILNDVLDLSKLEAGMCLIEKIDFSLTQMIADVASLMWVRAEAKGIEFQVNMVPPLPSRMETDPTRLRQILLNLVGNAIKFTEKGFVRLRVTLIDGKDGPEIEFAIVDTGIGMTREETERVFKPFTQADASLTRRFGGTGLGLAISMRLAELLHGSITVNTEPDRGSTFTFRLPEAISPSAIMLDEVSIEIDQTALTPTSPPKDFSGKRVLIVEDRPENRELLELLLRETRLEVESAGNGQEAIDYWNAVKDGRTRPVDMILMDMQMPLVDGYTATHALRRFGCQLPIIAVTAQAMKQDRQRCLSVGCDDFISKPYDYDHLLTTLSRYFETSPEVLQSSRASAPDLPAFDAATPIDFAELMKRTRGKIASMKLVLGMFCEKIPVHREQLRQLLAADDRAALKQLAHGIKGTAANLSAKAVYRSSENLERLAADAAVGDVDFQPAVDSLCDDLDQLLRFANDGIDTALAEHLNA